MINKELKHLSRKELVDIIYQLKKNEEELEAVIESQKKELQEKKIRLSMAGSIADAAMSVTNVFSTAQMTADLYLQEIAFMKEETEKECERKTQETEERVKAVLTDGEKKLSALKTSYKKEQIKLQQIRNEIKELEIKKKTGMI